MEFIDNFYPGACASIVFYQFVKSSDKLLYSDLEEFTKKLNNKLRNYELYDDLIKIKHTICKYWNGIRNETIKFKDLPTGGDLRPLKHPLEGFGVFGKSEYGLINYFCRILFCLSTGYWINQIVGNHYRNLSCKVNESVFKKYTKFTESYIKNKQIPYVTYVCYLDADDNIEGELHVISTLKIEENKYIVYNSNCEYEYETNRYIDLWFQKDDNIFY